MKLDLGSIRARKARLALRIGGAGGTILTWGGLVLGLAAAAILLIGDSRRLGYGLGVGALAGLITGLWYKRELSRLPANTPARSLDDIIEPKLLAGFKKGTPLTPRYGWQAATSQWQGRFILNHLLIAPDEISKTLSHNVEDTEQLWTAATDLMKQQNYPELDGGVLATALIIGNNEAKTYLARQNLKKEDLLETLAWLNRLNRALAEPRPGFGGIGRDWASGFTPTLDQFSQNVSAAVEAGRGHFHTLAHGEVLDSLVNSLARPGGSVALVGAAGTGKTSLVYALAERLLTGRDQDLLYHQIISLNASLILSAAGDKLEKTMLNLFAEAAHARNVIIFLDEAELFFGKGTGAFDTAQILLPLLQNQSVKLIAALTPEDWQLLRSSHESLAALMAPLIIKEPDQAATLRILEDTALTLEVQNHITVSYQAVREAYRLSDRFMQDRAYPGKAISLLEQAVPYAQNKFMSAESVQAAVEITRGVKVSKAEAPEADTLLHLEERIHSRMVNQQRAVQMVSAALRRGRTGVADPKRPVGSFLFLGPTGVGKTELARSLAAVYFGDERRMIRLDMTEYHRSEDAERLLEGGGPSKKSLILQIREQPFSVVLLDEVEKANPAVLNLLLQLLDEGQLTDKAGRMASFRSAIIIATSNAGSAEIAQRVAAGDTLESFERPLIDKLIASDVFHAELINRFDAVVLFRPLDLTELSAVAKFMLASVNQTLSKQNVSVQLSDGALAKLVSAGYDPQFGARPMRRVIANSVEDAVANKILRGEAQPGSVINLDVNDLGPMSSV
ncbi:ATP-dependent Clp protease ATP-binding subunit [Candidatus Saccharibacteria bacterium]|nr:ATP-dependent Clp protease ATP-binding subunit [Candidatus Saccharibacteria bacterium]